MIENYKENQEIVFRFFSFSTKIPTGEIQYTLMHTPALKTKKKWRIRNKNHNSTTTETIKLRQKKKKYTTKQKEILKQERQKIILTEMGSLF